ncbi:hypothetical protein ABB37_08660 [Leptomonas pyrrhocoris]|uniref:Uncharacterized protein n=1 Tax=Leptomonas pyrrhocoris TaxID=157538 RepID=A0A0M9FSY1_LEPPY|nr:hypothetical protein ABB37_08660 [Leptomonas pyrrhocoris]XP_015653822.1 hypothetical protein ABB37_08660 [Leptomonas pyrrhocoris]KPA75382.1 hypothetical protein ABB37_08660 [Leptomonas pyrrhocoris]KPA75383.1 hypothetical protein ABB37_08660 [Leptomonas pyrrhocoris]|eukprot:XP_015653821.1 hypothetical protein ABB37_08660 [Leptomonas pyrrhocoris]
MHGSTIQTVCAAPPCRAVWLLLLAITVGATAFTGNAQDGDTCSTARTRRLSPSALRGTVQKGPPAAAVAAPGIANVTSAPTTHLLAWWVAVLLVVGILGLVAACVLPIYDFCKGRSRHVEELARKAEINMSMQEMTARLYRTRQQQYERDFGVAAMQLQAIEVQAGEDGRRGSREERKTPLLPEGAMHITLSPLRGSAEVVAVRPRRQPNEAPSTQPLRGPRGGVGGEASVPDSSESGLTRRTHLLLTRPDEPHSDAAALEWCLSNHSIGSSSSSTSYGRSHALVCTLAARSASARTLMPTPSSGQLTHAPSVRAFAGMNKVEALRRALGGPQLHPVPSAHAVVPSTSPWPKRQYATVFVSPGAFGEQKAVSQDQLTDVIVEVRCSTAGVVDDADDDAGHRCSSGTVVLRGATAGLADSATSFPPPRPPPLSGAAAEPMERYTFLQRADHPTDREGASTDVDSTDTEICDAMGRTSSKMQRLRTPALDPAAAAASTTTTTTATPTVAMKESAELGDVAVPRIPGVMADSNLCPPTAPRAVSKSEVGAEAYAAEQAEEEVEEETEPSSKCSRFVVARNRPGSVCHRAAGRPMTVDNTVHSQGKAEEEEVDGDQSNGNKSSEVVRDDEQHFLSRTRTVKPRRGDPTIPASSPAWLRQRSAAPLNRPTEDDEYSNLMDFQFKKKL